jgi:ribosomal protein S19
MKKFLGYKGRSSWKGFFFCNSYTNTLRSMPRNVVFERDFLGLDLSIHNGKYLNHVNLNNNLVVGYKFGQFVRTKKGGKDIHAPKKKSKKGK